MLGGGVWVTQNKKLPGSYINFVSASRANLALGERGFVAMPLILDWGIEGEVFTVTNADFQKNSTKLFGYDYTDEKMKGLRDLFRNAKTLYAYRLGTGTKASCSYGMAAHGGVRGNDLSIVITALTTGFNVKTMLGTSMVDSQDVISATAKTNDLKNNDFITWTADVDLSAGTTQLTGGANGEITAEAYSTFLDKIEPYSFNVIGCVGADEAAKALFVAFTKRMRDEQGIKFQCVLHEVDGDHEGIISVANDILAESGFDKSSLVYWVSGACAGCEISKSNTNKLYDGEFSVNVDYTQAQLEAFIDGGKFAFHRVGDAVRVLEDINTLKTLTDEKGEDFKSNQTIRVIDQAGNDIAAMFNDKYIGVIPNDESGRISLWNDIVKHHQELQRIRAIENFSSEDVKVEAGETKKSVVVTDSITPTNCMSKLFMTIYVN